VVSAKCGNFSFRRPQHPSIDVSERQMRLHRPQRHRPVFRAVNLHLGESLATAAVHFHVDRLGSHQHVFLEARQFLVVETLFLPVDVLGQGGQHLHH